MTFAVPDKGLLVACDGAGLGVAGVVVGVVVDACAVGAGGLQLGECVWPRCLRRGVGVGVFGVFGRSSAGVVVRFAGAIADRVVAVGLPVGAGPPSCEADGLVAQVVVFCAQASVSRPR